MGVKEEKNIFILTFTYSFCGEMNLFPCHYVMQTVAKRTRRTWEKDSQSLPKFLYISSM